MLLPLGNASVGISFFTGEIAGLESQQDLSPAYISQFPEGMVTVILTCQGENMKMIITQLLISTKHEGNNWEHMKC